jgi:excinuclease ABC subunit A
VAAHILEEARARVRFLVDVGLGYLTLDRATRTLSGGEAQRIGLANSLGARLVDTLYVLDEPSVGLHSRDMQRLLGLLRRLRDAGNTVLVVEHDPEAIEVADHMIEIGPGSGEQGGHLVFAGPISRAAESPLTGQYLTGARTVPLPAMRRRLGPRWLTLTGAREHNLKGADFPCRSARCGGAPA